MVRVCTGRGVDQRQRAGRRLECKIIRSEPNCGARVKRKGRFQRESKRDFREIKRTCIWFGVVSGERGGVLEDLEGLQTFHQIWV